MRYISNYSQILSLTISLSSETILGIAIYILMTNYSFFFRHPFSRLVSAYYDKVLSASGMPEALKEYIFKEFKTRKRLPRYAVKQVRHLG